MRFEKQTDLQREMKAIKAFVGMFNGSYIKLGQHDIDFTILNQNHTVIGYAEVKGRNRLISDAFPLPIAVRKLVKLTDRKSEPVIIWACLDGIIFVKLKNVTGEIKMGGRKPREGSVNDIEMMAYYNSNKHFKTLKY